MFSTSFNVLLNYKESYFVQFYKAICILHLSINGIQNVQRKISRNEDAVLGNENQPPKPLWLSNPVSFLILNI